MLLSLFVLFVNIGWSSGHGQCTSEAKVISTSKDLPMSIQIDVLKGNGYCGIGSPVPGKKTTILVLNNCKNIKDDKLNPSHVFDDIDCKEYEVFLKSLKVRSEISVLQSCFDGMGPNGAVGSCSVIRVYPVNIKK